MRETQVHISVIVPVFNASQHIEYFCARLTETLIKTNSNFEIIFVNDGSSDDTSEKLMGMSQRDRRLRLINLPGNLGQYRAINKGIVQGRGEILIIMDDDQEYALGYTPLFLKKIASGDDLVLGWRTARNIPLYRRLGSQATNLLISALIGKRIHDLGGIKIFGNRGTSVLRSRGSLLGVVTSYRQLRISQIRMNDTSCRVSRYNLKKLFLLFMQVIRAQLGRSKFVFKGEKD